MRPILILLTDVQQMIKDFWSQLLSSIANLQVITTTTYSLPFSSKELFHLKDCSNVAIASPTEKIKPVKKIMNIQLPASDDQLGCISSG